MFLKHILLSVLTIGLVACSNPSTDNKTADSQATPPASTQQAMPTTAVEQTFILGVDGNYSPYTFKDEHGTPQGFDIDILRAIGEKQKFGINPIPQGWDEMLNNLEQAKNDIAMSGISRSEDRREKYLLSDTYAYGKDVILVKQDNTTITNFNTLAGHKVAVLMDSNYIPELEEVMGKNSPNIIPLSSSFLAFREFTAGKADAVYADETVLRYFVKQYPEVSAKFIDNGKDDYELVIMASKNKPELMKKINAGLKEIIADGTYAEIYKKWFGVEPKKIPSAN